MKRRGAETQRTTRFVYGLGLSAMLCAGSILAGETLQTTDPETQLSTWEANRNGVHLRLTQISPQQARAFMQARGLDAKSAEEFAHTCVYMTVLRNEGKSPIKYCLAEWRYTPASGTPQTMLAKHDWLAKWRPRKLPKSVKLAFDWSQFPFEQSFAPGDWNQGMTTFELPAGSRFDLQYRWWRNGKLYENTLRDVQCPANFD